MYSVEQKLDIIKNTEIFGALSEESLQMISQRMGEKHFRPASMIVKEGAPGDSLMVICQGEVEVIKGANTVLATLERGDILGEMACLSGSMRSTSARAQNEVSVLFLKGDALRLLMHQYPEISIGFIRVLIERLQTANKIIQTLENQKGKEPTSGAFLRIKAGPQEKKVVIPDILVVGRGNPDDRTAGRLNLKGGYISQRHATVFKHKGNYFIRDLKSSNGTRLNGIRIQEIISLSSGDRIDIGDVSMVFEQG